MKENRTDSSDYTPTQIAFFFVLAFAITWAVLIPGIALVPEEGQIPFFILGAFGPFLAAVIVIGFSKGKHALLGWLRRIFRIRLPLILYLGSAFLLPLVVGGLHYALYRFSGGAPDFDSAIPWYWYLAYLIPTALLTGGNEEPGWRGFALPALLRWFHPVIASLILGVIHSLWHLPMMGHYSTSIGWYLLNLVPLTFIFNWLYLKSNQSVIPVMLFHASTNVIGDFIPTPQETLNGFGNYMVFRSAVYWILALVILIYTKGRLSYKVEA
jgi:membrane protease YdiL (CAAX protease family)